MFRLLGTLISGAIVGWIAGQIMGTKSSLLRNIVVGIIGSFVGSFLSGILGIWAYGWLAGTNVYGANIMHNPCTNYIPDLEHPLPGKTEKDAPPG